MNSSKIMGYSHPGATRQLSILQGLKDIQMHVGMDVNVLIHDGARPWLSVDMITRCMKGLEEHEGIMPVLPMKDTIYMSQDGCRVSELLDRQKLYAGQSPEAFRMEAYYKANQALMPERILKINGSTEPAILAGLDVGMIPGEETNYKITTDADLKRFQEQIEKGL
jgi:2-C-methyl-D-erythritol 4-phosphate cytidylyltransferase